VRLVDEIAGRLETVLGVFPEAGVRLDNEIRFLIVRRHSVVTGSMRRRARLWCWTCSGQGWIGGEAGVGWKPALRHAYGGVGLKPNLRWVGLGVRLEIGDWRPTSRLTKEQASSQVLFLGGEQKFNPCVVNR
jgi:hypothetical protein